VSSAANKTNPPQDYALSKVDFSDPVVGQGTTAPTSPSPSSSDSNSDLKKPSLVFVRSAEAISSWALFGPLSDRFLLMS
jgi:hypothetical protein